MTTKPHLILNKQQEINQLNYQLDTIIENNISEFKDNIYFHFNEKITEDSIIINILFTLPISNSKHFRNEQRVKEFKIDFSLMLNIPFLFIHSGVFSNNISNKMAALYLHSLEVNPLDSWFDESNEISNHDYINRSHKKITKEFWNDNIYKIIRDEKNLNAFINEMNKKYILPYIDNYFANDMNNKNIFMNKYENSLNEILNKSLVCH